MYKKLIAIPFVLFVLVSGISQNNKAQVSSLNAYVDFTNNSIHGMLIVHRLLENFNSDLNSYVDLEKTAFEFVSNKQLPKNIFEDKDRFFYPVSPLELFDRLPKSIPGISQKEIELLNRESRILKNIFTAVNRLRFDLEEAFISNDLSTKKGLDNVYALLEKGVKMYDDFYKHQKIIEDRVYAIVASSMHPNAMSTYKTIHRAHKAQKDILNALRNKDDQNFESLIKKAESEKHLLAKALQAYSASNTKIFVKRAEQLLTEAIMEADKFYTTAEVSPAYRLYGKFYYYFNDRILGRMNWYGLGYVYQLNTLISELQLDVPKLVEEVQIFQVIYPKKLKEPELIISSDNNIEHTPEKLKLRNIRKSDHIINASQAVFELELYDHKIQDGDIVSINYNGDWILEQHSLEGAPTKLKLLLNKSGKNYLLLHAENVGRNPPNTMALAYDVGEETKRIVLSSDLNESALIEINLQ